VAEDDGVAHPVPAEIEVPVLQAQGLVHGRSRSISNGGVARGFRNREASGLDSTAPVGRSGFWLPFGRRPPHLQWRWTTRAFSCSAAGEDFSLLGVEGDLGDPPPVPEVDKYMPPWSRRRCTQPASLTLSPTFLLAKFACGVRSLWVALMPDDTTWFSSVAV
jgi:hypothetical protein